MIDTDGQKLISNQGSCFTCINIDKLILAAYLVVTFIIYCKWCATFLIKFQTAQIHYS